MTNLEGLTYVATCDRCGARLILASGGNAVGMDKTPKEATDCGAKSGWAVEANGEVECAGCAKEIESDLKHTDFSQ